VSIIERCHICSSLSRTCDPASRTYGAHMGGNWAIGLNYGPHLGKSHGDHLGKMGPTSPMWAPYGFCTVDTQVRTGISGNRPSGSQITKTHTSCPICGPHMGYKWARWTTWATNGPDGSHFAHEN
jgi:hypothetical protein